MISEEILKGNINSTERQLLWDIREELRQQNKLLTQMIENMTPKPQEVVDVKELEIPTQKSKLRKEKEGAK